MPLHVPPAPAPALRSVLAALGSPTAVHEAHTPSLRQLQGPVTAELPLPVHVLDRLDGSGRPAGGRPPRTRLTGWRFLIRSGDRFVAAADTRLTPDGWAFSHFFEGPYVAATERALRQAESLGKNYQPRLLSVPELYMLTLWLHGAVGADAAAGLPAAADLLVPLAPAPPGIAAFRPHPVSELLPVLTHRLTRSAPPVPPSLAAPAA
ncbi:hypothetical protein ACFZBM_32435 [Streptomyces lavendulae]|uniref:Uncharacterized protein n=1 Tax=Streptomyces lavendulae subsp. lavendulae TaxID=58340 RepID=A0A2K8PMI4_STRLA|nr:MULTISPECIES: hypothetical protein [Streptomyces]GLX35777.1 hypothetical protein Sros01_18500 [Streptomyces roseochromogenus]ATZ27951.1 hypothetical protein SLAV_30885 [Streptomyces lavendulae subsp. lavendulae]MDH6545747.1 hypothetical protein [Streptomyces sp. SPB4]QUQ57778.1 hypothetical protein SLLC_29050 [Streptomyces lavendulae subsp. lavendulae]GLW00980.1 hypothetical protein Slala05_46110 [Streptomyces lavendulae subsp. lavendulae]